MTFRILWVIDAIVTLVFGYFFVVGLGDGSVSSFNMALWVGILAALGSVLLCSLKLRSAGQTLIAILLLLLPAVPSVGFGLFMLALILGHPNWQ